MVYKNKVKEQQYKKKYYWENKERILRFRKRYYQKNKERILYQKKKYYQKNPERLKKEGREPTKIYYYKNRRIKIQKGEEYRKKRIQLDFKFHLDTNMGTIISMCLKGKKASRKWENLVSYTLEDLIKHLENLFDENMNWDNYGSYWWIDHKKPRSLFRYTFPEDPEFKKCWALENLQPMEKIANIKKGNLFN